MKRIAVAVFLLRRGPHALAGGALVAEGRLVHLAAFNLDDTGSVVLAGVLLGGCAMLVPQVMGIGYDTVNLALLGQLGIASLLVMLLAKLAATSVCIGLGVPGGMIGPALFIGAMLGALLTFVSAPFGVAGAIPDRACKELLDLDAVVRLDDPGFFGQTTPPTGGTS